MPLPMIDRIAVEEKYDKDSVCGNELQQRETIWSLFFRETRLALNKPNERITTQNRIIFLHK